MTFNTDLCLTNTEVTIDSYNKNYVTDVPKRIIYEPTSMNRNTINPRLFTPTLADALRAGAPGPG